MRSGATFTNCLQGERQLPAVVGSEPLTLTIDVADDTRAAADRLSGCRLRLHVEGMTSYDELEVAFNGDVLACDNPMQAGQYMARTMDQVWLEYGLLDHLPLQGMNEVTLRMVERHEPLAAEFEISVEDVELEIRYEYPNGIW